MGMEPINSISSIQAQTMTRPVTTPKVTNETACKVFGDVKTNKFYTAAICWAYNEGIATGTPETGLFGTNDTLTRQQMATFFFRYTDALGMSTSERGEISSMLNADKVSGYAREAVEWAVGAGLISGSEKTDANGNKIKDLNPRGNTTRAQVAVILQRFCENNHL